MNRFALVLLLCVVCLGCKEIKIQPRPKRQFITQLDIRKDNDKVKSVQLIFPDMYTDQNSREHYYYVEDVEELDNLINSLDKTLIELRAVQEVMRKQKEPASEVATDAP